MNTASPPRFAVIGPERAELGLDDGAVLVADIYRPSGGHHPVLLMRQPYGRAIASTVVFAHPAWYAARGYIVVVQDVRGCGDSGGDYQAFVNEAADGVRTLDWAAELPYSSGRIGLYGFSYQAVTQYLALAGGGRRPDALAPAMGGWSLRDDWAYEGGAFRIQNNVGWAVQMAKLKAARAGDLEAHAALSGPCGHDRLRELLVARPDLSHLAAWLADDPSYWARIAPSQLLADDPLDIPVLHTGGWNDFLLGGTLAADAAFRAKSPQTAHLVVGPWAHLPWNRSAGTADMGAAAEFSVDRAQLAFFDFYLKGQGERPPSAQMFDMGRRRWLTLPHRPAAASTSFFLASSGLAAALVSDGRLAREPGEPGEDLFVHDPTRPAPMVGGALGTPNGFADPRAADDRADVAVYTTPPFEKTVLLAGEAKAAIQVATAEPGFDLSARLSLVHPQGGAFVLATGYARSHAGGSQEIAIALNATCATVPAGCALRLSLQGGGWPAFDIHPASGMGAAPVTLQISHGAMRPSRIDLPILSEETPDADAV
ncbi:CocE/NonD family hydrolase [Chelativorans sp. AA-79]|uniref:CocE/NonD family hydrolase n=1 Tax=Chelativorans sp. AA-79 TaxID=3028735 RepID=UPI0023F6D557|nr:CocE/NonD family hydrolase [Chelativorans sp. AA-79]WEX09649.1 CocE/NonD family hydrolase [Chelativorans sp. AA-79]